MKVVLLANVPDILGAKNYVSRGGGGFFKKTNIPDKIFFLGLEPFPSTATGEDRSSQEISIVRLKIVMPKLTIFGDQWSDL